MRLDALIEAEESSQWVQLFLVSMKGLFAALRKLSALFASLVRGRVVDAFGLIVVGRHCSGGHPGAHPRLLPPRCGLVNPQTRSRSEALKVCETVSQSATMQSRLRRLLISPRSLPVHTHNELRAVLARIAPGMRVLMCCGPSPHAELGLAALHFATRDTFSNAEQIDCAPGTGAPAETSARSSQKRMWGDDECAVVKRSERWPPRPTCEPPSMTAPTSLT